MNSSIDGGKIFGSQLKKYANILNVLEVEDQIDELRKLFNIIKKRNFDFLKNIRHNVSGHKDRNIRKQLIIN
jgi:hypothetical protein